MEIRKDGYTIVPNSYVRDARLSIKAIGLMTIMLSLPDGWEFSIVGLASICKDGMDSIRSALKELEEFGYVLRRRVRKYNGKLGAVEYTLSAEPAQDETYIGETQHTETPVEENPSVENPTLGNRPQINKDRSNKDGSSKDIYTEEECAGARVCVREGEPEEDRTSPDWGMSEEDKAVRKVLLEFVPCGIAPPNQYTADDIEGMILDSQWGLTPDARADTIIRAMRAVGEGESGRRAWGNVKGLLRYWQKNGERGKKVNANASNGSFEGREGYSWDDAELERFNREFYDVYVAGSGKSG